MKINNLIRYKYPIGTLFVFVNGGLSNGFVVKETNYKKEVSKFYTQRERVFEGLALDPSRTYEQGYIIGAGLQYNRLSLEIRLDNGNGISKNNGLTSSTKSYFVLLGYRF